MARAEKEYRKLPGRGSRRGTFLTYSRLWLGKDHLLIVDSNGFAESYKRFYFRDIQALTVTRTSRRAQWNIALGCGAALFGVFALASEEGALVFFAILAGLCVGGAIFNTVRGATCRVSLTTAVQSEQLPSLGRIPRARKILAQLQPLIRAAQTPPEPFASSIPDTGEVR